MQQIVSQVKRGPQNIIMAFKGTMHTAFGEKAMKLGKFRKGQIAVVMTLVIATLVGVMSLGADVGVMYYNWVQLQKGADAAAVAGASYLNEGAAGVTLAAADVNANCTGQSDDAKKAACTYAINNGLATDANSLTINEPGQNLPAGAASPNIQVVATRNNLPYVFGRAIGLSTYKVAAMATAAQASAGGGHIFPVGLQCTPSGNPLSCPDPFAEYQNLTLTEKFAGDTFAPGNWAYLGPDGGGAQTVSGDIANGSSSLISYLGTVSTQTGNISNSQQLSNGFNARVTRHNNMSGDVPGTQTTCSTVQYSQVCSGSVKPCTGDPLAIIVPLVNFNGANGNSNLTVYGFAELYLNPAFNPKTDTSMQACFITTLDPQAVAGSGAPANGVLPPPSLIQ